MLKPNLPHCRTDSGLSMIEVLATLLILSFGLLSLASLLSKMQLAQMESYQREQGVILATDMAQRLSVNYANVDAYVTGTGNPLGTGDGQPTSCSTLAMGAVRDACEWSNALKGAAETSGTSKLGAMIGARGCIEQVQAAVGTPNCTPALYRVSVAWQGLSKTTAPALACGADQYGDDANRRLVSVQVAIGQPSC
jgi:type IV pilus assembly protein PilV